MVKQKWDIDGKGAPPTGNMGYEGPDLPKGSWPAKVKRMTVTKIKSQGENHGKPRISVLLEVSGLTGEKAKFNGAPVWDGLNIIPSSLGFVNAFLHGLTDGSDAAKRQVESWFWDKDKGPDVKTEENKAGEKVVHIKRIGKYQVNSPDGSLVVQITTRPDSDLNGNYRPAITGYIPSKTSNLVEAEDDFGDDDDDDIENDDIEDEDDDDIEDDEEEDVNLVSDERDPF
jgi:hypothetical protein